MIENRRPNEARSAESKLQNLQHALQERLSRPDTKFALESTPIYLPDRQEPLIFRDEIDNRLRLERIIIRDPSIRSTAFIAEIEPANPISNNVQKNLLLLSPPEDGKGLQVHPYNPTKPADRYADEAQIQEIQRLLKEGQLVNPIEIPVLSAHVVTGLESRQYHQTLVQVWLENEDIAQNSQGIPAIDVAYGDGPEQVEIIAWHPASQRPEKAMIFFSHDRRSYSAVLVDNQVRFYEYGTDDKKPVRLSAATRHNAFTHICQVTGVELNE